MTVMRSGLPHGGGALNGIAAILRRMRRGRESFDPAGHANPRAFAISTSYAPLCDDIRGITTEAAGHISAIQIGVRKEVDPTLEKQIGGTLVG